MLLSILGGIVGGLIGGGTLCLLADGAEKKVRGLFFGGLGGAVVGAQVPPELIEQISSFVR